MKNILILCLMFFATVCVLGQNIVAAEYFWDEDPGAGNGFALNVGTPDDVINATFTISTAGLPQGQHLLCVRTLNAEGDWSTAEYREVLVHRFEEVECFWDQDPGAGNGISFAQSTTNADVTNSFNVSTSGIKEGNHMLYVRNRGYGGSWGMAKGQPVYIENKIVGAEYYWNSDPGVGNGTSLDIGTPDSDVTFTDDISTVGLDTTVDIHCLVVRTQTANEAWSVMLDTCLFLGPVGLDEWNIASSLNMYPNPANTALRISFESPTIEKINYSIYNSAGQTVMNKGFLPTSTTISEDIDVSSFEAGVYFISMQSAGKAIRLVFVKE